MGTSSKALGSLFVAAAAAIALSASTGARADNPHFDVKGVGKGKIEVQGKGGFHINVQGPWAVTAGGKTFDKSKWNLSEHSAKIEGIPAGAATVKVYVCSGDKCENATATVNVD